MIEDALDTFSQIPYPGEWRLQAKCRGVTHVNFFPEVGDNRAAREAQVFCYDCPVFEQCREYGIQHPMVYGTWGALGQKARRKMAPKKATQPERKQERLPRASPEESYLSPQTKAETSIYMRAYKKGLRGSDLPKFSKAAQEERAEYMRLYRNKTA